MPESNDAKGRKFSAGNAVALLGYQAGSIVSREIVRRKGGTVTLFAFDEGQGLSEHTAPFDALVVIVEGIAEVTIGGQPQKLAKDDMVLMPANVPHAVKALTPFKMLLVMVRETTT